MLTERTLKNMEETIKNSTEKTESFHDFAPTGSFLLNLIVGGGKGYGYPFGKIINIVGDKSSGKTFLACEVIAACHYIYGDKFKWVFDDCESGFGFDTESLYGFEIMPKMSSDRTRSDTVEDAYVNVRKFAEKLKKDEYGIYVIDSLDGLTSKEANKLADEHYKKASNGKDVEGGSYRLGKAKYLSQEFLPQLSDLLEEKNCLLIIISQVRENIDPMSFDKYVRAGGKALDFYSHTVLWLANVNKIKVKGRAIGVTIKAKTTKSKTPRPYREGFLDLKFSYGLDDIATNLDFLFDFRTDKGELIRNPTAIWNEGKEVNAVSLKEFLITNNFEEDCRRDLGGKLKKNEVLEWIQNNDQAKKKFSEEFGQEMSRDELITFIETNNLEEELRKRTELKWETIENSLLMSRRPKYRV